MLLLTHQPRSPLLLRLAFTIGLSVLPLGCVSLQVEPLTTTTYPRNPSTVEWLTTAPNWPHTKIARIIATSGSASEARLRAKMLARAGCLGADAVILGKSDVLEVMGAGGPYQSTLTPAGATMNGSPWGWWTPFYLDPWSYVETPTDETRWIDYLSGVAIRRVTDAPSIPTVVN